MQENNRLWKTISFSLEQNFMASKLFYFIFIFSCKSLRIFLKVSLLQIPKQLLIIFSISLVCQQSFQSLGQHFFLILLPHYWCFQIIFKAPILLIFLQKLQNRLSDKYSYFHRPKDLKKLEIDRPQGQQFPGMLLFCCRTIPKSQNCCWIIYRFPDILRTMSLFFSNFFFAVH